MARSTSDARGVCWILGWSNNEHKALDIADIWITPPLLRHASDREVEGGEGRGSRNRSGEFIIVIKIHNYKGEGAQSHLRFKAHRRVTQAEPVHYCFVLLMGGAIVAFLVASEDPSATSSNPKIVPGKERRKGGAKRGPALCAF